MNKLHSIQASYIAMWDKGTGTVNELIDISDIIVEGKVVDYDAYKEGSFIFTKEIL